MNDQNERPRGTSLRAADAGNDGPPVVLILGIVVAVATALFVASNGERVPVKFLGAEIATPPSWVLIVVSMVLGVVLTRLFGWFWRRRKRNKG